MKRTVFDPLTERTYGLEHLQPRQVMYQIQINGEAIDVPLVMVFSPHCYTESRKAHHPDHAVILYETKRRGVIDERVFCTPRWEFSKSLPGIIKGLHSKVCYLGDREIFYRQEDVPAGNTHAGWYICCRLDASERHKNLTLSVRSAHWRTNRPIDVQRGPPRKFYAILANFYEREKSQREWLK